MTELILIIWGLSALVLLILVADSFAERREQRRYRENSRGRHPSRLVRRDHTSTCGACGRFLGLDPEQLKLVEHHTLYHSRPVGAEDTSWWSEIGRFQ